MKTSIWDWLIDRMWPAILRKMTVTEAATLWQSNITACLWCQKPIPTERAFCEHCGASQQRWQHTTEEMEDLHILDQSRIDTDMLGICRLPGERLLDTYNRIKSWKRMEIDEQ